MVKTLDITELQQLVGKLPEVSAAGSILKKADVISVKGLHGSSRALFSSALFNKNSGVYLYILNDAESAGYFYHDLTQIVGSKDVLFFPSAYKRAAKFGQLDAANEILRTETLSRLPGCSCRKDGFG
jgi:transcription-repair coupling factor (superfamily II helicase)